MENEKKKPDYSASAEKLCNPPEVGKKIAELHKAQNTLEILEGQRPAKLEYTVEVTQKRIADITAQVKSMVDAQGSYQDIESGEYAVKYRRMIKGYHIEPFKQAFPKYVSAVIEETINVKVLEGLFKGKVLFEGELKDIGAITESPTFAYYIR